MSALDPAMMSTPKAPGLLLNPHPSSRTFICVHASSDGFSRTSLGDDAKPTRLEAVGPAISRAGRDRTAPPGEMVTGCIAARLMP